MAEKKAQARSPQAAQKRTQVEPAPQADTVPDTASWIEGGEFALPSGNVRQLQRQLGNRGTTQLIQRQAGNTAAAAPPAPAAQTPEDAEKELLEREAKARDALNARKGQPGVDVYYRRPGMPDFDPKTDIEPFLLDEVFPRRYSDNRRISFDSEGPARAWASLAGPPGAVVAREGGFYFVMKLQGAGREFNRGLVNYVNVKGYSLTTSASADGFDMPTGNYEPDAEKNEKKGKELTADDLKRGVKPDQAQVADAKDMRSLLGINPGLIGPNGEKDPASTQDVVTLTRDQSEKFILTYMMSRGVEVLNQNESMAYSMLNSFKPDSQKEGPNKATAEAQVMITSAHKVAKQYKVILDDQRKLEVELNQLNNEKSKHGTIYMDYVRNGKQERKNIVDWISDVKADQSQIDEKKNAILANSPVVAQLVEQQPARSDWDVDKEKAISYLTPVLAPGYWLAGQFNKKPENPVDRSPFGSPQTAEGDEKIRAAFLAKLDAVLMAVRETRARTLGGDINFLFSLEGLRSRVRADLTQVKGANGAMPVIFDQMAEKVALDKSKKEFGIMGAQIALEVGALFFPPLHFVSAALGFVTQIEKVEESSAKYTASNAAVDPSKALADNQKATEQLADDAFWLVISAMDLAQSLNNVAKGMEAGAKTFEPPKPLSKEAMVAEANTTLGSAKNAYGEVKVSKQGFLFSCHSPCEELRQRYAAILMEDKELSAELAKIEARSGRAAREGGEESQKLLAQQAAAEAAVLEAKLFQAKDKIEKLEKALADLINTNPALKASGLDAPALRRSLSKGTDVQNVKGLLQEELYNLRMKGLNPEELKKFASPNSLAQMEGKQLQFIEGHRVRLDGKEITDGMIGFYTETGEFKLVGFIESKGKGVRKKLSSQSFDLAERDIELIKNEIVEDLRELNPETLQGMKSADIQKKYPQYFTEEAVKKKAAKPDMGEVRNDFERLMSDSGKPVLVEIDGKQTPVQASPATTKVTGVYPSDVNPGRMEQNIMKDINQGDRTMPFAMDTDKVPYKSEDIQKMAEAISQAAEQAKGAPQ